jgi:uncharacterized repeat protein (TIGR02543 family)
MTSGARPAIEVPKSALEYGSSTTYYTINFNANGGSVTQNYTSVESGNSVGTLPTPTAPEGKEFDGWYTGISEGIKVDSTYVPSSNITVYARYSTICGAPVSFSTDSWETVACNVAKDNYARYSIGDEKEVAIDMNGDGTNESYTIRLVNTTTSEECKQYIGYSQTSCGVVLEFVDSVANKKINNTRTNEGGWKESSLATWLNGDFFDKLPNDLKSIIIPTYPIISSPGRSSSYSGFVEGISDPITELDVSKNKIYLLSTREVNVLGQRDTKTNTDLYTRVLDYYSDSDPYTYDPKREKTDINGNTVRWWLRSAHAENSTVFFDVTNKGLGANSYANETEAVTPAFRIGADYAVMFNTNGGIDIDNQIVKYGGKATKPSDPTKGDSQFVGWYADDIFTVEFDFNNTAITKPTTIYAKWSGDVDLCNGFSMDSWSTIVSNLNDNSSYYPIGCEKEVELDMDSDGTDESYMIRLANTSTPDVCSTEGYSQTACGTVIEFKDIVSVKNMDTSSTNDIGGWKSTQMVNWLNNDFYNKLPSDLRSVIMPTYPIVSGSTYDGSSPNITADDETMNRIYLLSVREVGIEDPTYDLKNDPLLDTRTLDFYSLNTDDSFRIKRELSGTLNYWWLRSALAFSFDKRYFYTVSYNGAKSGDVMGNTAGVTPAFRIGSN